jgi:peptide/nickel transport system permease protein
MTEQGTIETSTELRSTGGSKSTTSRVAAWVRRNRLAAFGIVVGFLIILLCLLAPVLFSLDPTQQDLSNVLKIPSGAHPLGTDQLGRDVLVRVFHAGRISIVLMAITLSVGLLLGLVVGVLAGYLGGWVDRILMQVVDLFLSLPTLILATALVGILGPGLLNLIIALVVNLWPPYARLVRSQVLTIRESEMITAARALGGTSPHIMLRHVIPGLLGPLSVQLALDAGQVMLIVAALSFLGLGVQPPTPEWGQMLVDARPFMQVAVHLVMAPGLAILLTVYGFNSLADLLEDYFNPRSN